MLSISQDRSFWTKAGCWLNLWWWSFSFCLNVSYGSLLCLGFCHVMCSSVTCSLLPQLCFAILLCNWFSVIVSIWLGITGMPSKWYFIDNLGVWLSSWHSHKQGFKPSSKLSRSTVDRSGRSGRSNGRGPKHDLMLPKFFGTYVNI